MHIANVCCPMPSMCSYRPRINTNLLFRTGHCSARPNCVMIGAPSTVEFSSADYNKSIIGCCAHVPCKPLRVRCRRCALSISAAGRKSHYLICAPDEPFSCGKRNTAEVGVQAADHQV